LLLTAILTKDILLSVCKKAAHWPHCHCCKVSRQVLTNHSLHDNANKGKQGQCKTWRIPLPKYLTRWPWPLTYDLENQ
jgi:hypothetical protein